MKQSKFFASALTRLLGAQIKICHELLESDSERLAGIEAAIRVGDVYALLTEYYHSQGNMQQVFALLESVPYCIANICMIVCQAYALIEKMRGRGIILSPYMDQQMVESIYKAMGIETDDNVGDDDIGEDIVEDEVFG